MMVGHRFAIVAGAIRAIFQLSDQAFLAQKIQVSVHRPQTQSRQGPPDVIEDLLGRWVQVAAPQKSQDGFALRSIAASVCFRHAGIVLVTVWGFVKGNERRRQLWGQ